MIKNILRFCLVASFFSFHFVYTLAQNVPVGEWDDALSYGRAVGVAESDDYVYCATTLAAFSVSRVDFSIQRFTKINGLSDMECSAIAFDSIHNSLIIAYSNSNIDILSNGTTINIPDIKNKNIIGDKSIYSIHTIGDYAYCCCGFGIVVLDLAKYEIKDTYHIGPNGAELRVSNVASDGVFLYAATDSGLLKAPITDPFLANFNEWYSFSSADGIHRGKFSDVVFWNGTMFASKGDSIFVLNNGLWSIYYQRTGKIISRMTSGIDLLVCQTGEAQISIFHSSGAMDSIGAGGFIGYPLQAVDDNTGSIWIADNYHSLIRYDLSGLSPFYPNGPASSSTFDLAVNSNTHNLYVAPGAYDQSFNITYNQEGFFARINNYWSKWDASNSANKDSFDVETVAVNPADNHIWFGTMWNGVFEFDDQLGIVNQYDNTNSTLDGAIRQQVTGIAFDANGHTWFSNLGSTYPIVVRKEDGTWLKFKPTITLDAQRLTEIAFDQFGQVWFVLPRQGVMVYNPGSDLDSPNDDQYKLLTAGTGLGNLPSTYVNSIAADQDGNIWVGTTAGVAIFYCPGDVFSSSGCEAQQIVVTAEDGYNGYLLGTENVTQIKIDGANRKWMGTDNGLWLFSSDGTTQLNHFTTDNSPLVSNSITSFDIDHNNGCIWIGTQKGIMMYRGDATVSPEGQCGPYVFPNPVRHDYNGTIAIAGVANNAEVKITDIAGNLIFRTQSNGGEIAWDGNDYGGARVATGVYLVFASNADGTLSCVTKLLVVR